MQASVDKPQPRPQKVKNILIRHSSKVKHHENTHSAEIFHILKYSPKYYRSLALEITSYIPLLSKVKKIKKLKEFTRTFSKNLPVKIWSNILANIRKEIEEDPHIYPREHQMKRNKSFWKRLNMEKIKFFPNLKRILLPRRKNNYQMNDNDSFLSAKKLFVSHVWNMRRIKSVEILMNEDNYEQIEWLFQKLNRMEKLLGRLGNFLLEIKTEDTWRHDLFQNKNVFSCLTALKLSTNFDPIFIEIPQTCKALISLSIYPYLSKNEGPKFLDFLSSLQTFVQLKRLAFRWPVSVKNSWGYFKPHPAIQRLQIKFSASNLINKELFGDNIELKDAVAHWEEMQALEMLKLDVAAYKVEEVIFVKQFITLVLKKIRKLCSLKLRFVIPFAVDEPFFVKDVSHLYGSLEKFEFSQYAWTPDQNTPTKMDLSFVKPFGKLKELRLEGNLVLYENVEEVVSLLQENQKEGERPVLEIKSKTMFDDCWLGESLKKIEKIKKKDKNLKIKLVPTFKTNNYVELLEKLCRDIQGIKPITGLVIFLIVNNNTDEEPLPVERVAEVLRRYAEICSLEVLMSNEVQGLDFKRIKGEKESFYIEDYERN